ncbi:MAG: 5-(carboxyamino)imidazole ribonucleotide mutase [Deltaproteobacteria bacterium]|jgi:phosphoribosylaminoimidazole carboxylase PurE protein|nr:5-(carboxyamino)imidazole ribonucleotide mutase [Deltaproteobacteria bacterium]
MNHTSPNTRKALVGLVMGSDSDRPVMKEAALILDSFGIPWEMTVASAHRSPKLTGQYAQTARDRGLRVIIAGAGYAAHLAGVMAAETILPVIGIPLAASSLGGLDSLLSTVMMPSGVPVATVTIGGAKNAAVLAAQILALNDKSLARKLLDYKKDLADKVSDQAVKLKQT